MKKNPTESELQAIINDQAVRREVSRKSHFWFFHIYFGHYVTYQTAPFQRELFALTEDTKNQALVVVAFRGSGKSTIMNLSYPIWSILGFHQKKFVLIAGQTQQQARQHLQNIKEELERNKLLKADLGPFEEQNDEWRSYSLVIPKYNARITAVSTEQSVRGIRHNQYRPDLIICDDIEDMASVKTQESRDKTFQWLTGELIPAGDRSTRLIMIGNLLHEDSILMRMKDKTSLNEVAGIYREYPLLHENGDCLWPGKYPDQSALEGEKKRVGSESAWQREYLLNIVTDLDRVIFSEWIKYYDELPDPALKGNEYRQTAIGIDLAISKRESADYTAMVAGRMYGYGDKRKIYILPNPVNERLSHLETLERAKLMSKTLGHGGSKATLYVEEVGYQGSMIEHLKHDGYRVEGCKPHGQDKRSRLALVSHMVQNGEVLFPRQGAERLIRQLTHFGLEKHDDLADAFAMLILELMNQKGCSVGLWVIPRGGTISGNLMDMVF